MSDLEDRLRLSIVLVALQRSGDDSTSLDDLVERTGLTRQQIIFDLFWIRMAGHDVRIESRGHVRLFR